jgi:actin
MEDIQALVIDNGSGITKAGFAGEETPRAMFSTAVGTPKCSSTSDYYVGDCIASRKSVLNVRFPIVHGVITNFDDMEKVWHHIFSNELRVAPAEHPVLLTEVSLNPKANREKMTQIMFETFETPATYISVQPILSLYACGRVSGVVVDCGDGASQITTVYEGREVAESIKRLDFGGRDVTDYLIRLLQQRGYSINSYSERDTIRLFKEKYCYTAFDFKEEIDSNDISDIAYELPDGNSISVGNERFKCTELLFQPSLIGKQFDGLHTTLFNSISACEIDLRRDLYKNIILTGGNSMFENIVDRLLKETIYLAPAHTNVRIIDPPERNYSAWIGGSALASLSTFQQLWHSKAEYEESGPGVIRCRRF